MTTATKKWRGVYNDGSRFAVDAGNISVLDLAYIKENGGGEEDDMWGTTVIEVPRPGKYLVKLTVYGSWLGTVRKEGIVNVRSGKLMVGDAGYMWPSEDPGQKYWSDFLDRTECLDAVPTSGGIVCDTGGDGMFRVRVEVKEV